MSAKSFEGHTLVRTGLTAIAVGVLGGLGLYQLDDSQVDHRAIIGLEVQKKDAIAELNPTEQLILHVPWHPPADQPYMLDRATLIAGFPEGTEYDTGLIVEAEAVVEQINTSIEEELDAPAWGGDLASKGIGALIGVGGVIALAGLIKLDQQELAKKMEEPIEETLVTSY
jgi:hypothetical protein